ncbi:hypothetical protein CRYUN_Cryun17cG0146500 [Craigia yunnanensis]
MNETLPPPSPSSDGDDVIDGAWYGNIQYLLNISTIGLLCCVLIFLFLKLRSDHRRIPGPSALFARLLAFWHATGSETARHCGADAAQFLLIEGGSFAFLLSVAVLAVFVLLPVNLYGGTALLDDQFSKTTGLPKSLGVDKSVLLEYFQYRYPGNLYRVILPMDLCALDDLATDLVKFRDEITWLVAKIDSSLLPEEDEVDMNGAQEFLGWEVARLRAQLETELAAYKEGRAQGAGVAFVMFKDVYTANKAVQDFWNEKKRRFGKFFSVMELQLQRNQWKVERAPLATDIYWNHLGSTKLSLKLRRVFVNACLLLMLLFFSSPLAVITAVQSAARIINAEAIDSAQLWHLTVSCEQRAALLKMVCFFLVNLILLRAFVESSLESAILQMGRCYLDGENCKRIEQYMSASFLSRSCLSSLAFLITSTFLGISYDLLTPIPWIKKKLQKFRKNDMLQLVPEKSEAYPLENQDLNSL